MKERIHYYFHRDSRSNATFFPFSPVHHGFFPKNIRTEDYAQELQEALSSGGSGRRNSNTCGSGACSI